jgi:cytochrome d ubiquinol oxidase subunit II
LIARISPEVLVAGIILISLTLYVLTGGADYGAGVWTLFARGPRGAVQRDLIAAAIAPIWEANHVWLILVMTLLFTAFPPAFALITTRLHIPLTLLLIGIVLRGAAFAFRAAEVRHRTLRPQLQSVFAMSSILAPVLLGVTVGAIASGRLPLEARGFSAAFVWPWFSVFPFAVGLLALTLFMLLAAVYLIHETDDGDLREDFRRRALWSAAASLVIAAAVLVLAAREAPHMYDGLLHRGGGRAMLVLAAVCGSLVLGALWFRQYALARAAAVGEVTAVLWGWGLGQYPFLVPSEITIESAATARITVWVLLAAVSVGALILFPSLYYLYRVFKSHAVFEQENDHEDLSS